tara:strand:+ start:1687 stop:2505 length:819 start_codon:yes stop_codon:yes gene_type:complete
MLTIYAPSDKPDSKCWEVFKGVQKTWKEPVKIADNSITYFLNDDSQSMFWGLVNNNTNLIHQVDESGQTWWFTDTPYFGRFDNNNLKPDNHYWRICKNNIHVPYFKNLDNKRLKNFNITVKDKRTKGDYILVCPSSAGIHGFINELDWLENTINKIKKFTDRPIVVREKPRGRGTSGPSEASVHIKDQLSNAWACVTSCSISAVESLSEGVPVICHAASFASPVCDTDVSSIEDPTYVQPSDWLNSLSYQQFTPEEFENGTAVSILNDLGVL